MNALTPQAGLAAIHSLAVARPRRLHIVHSESSCGWGGQELRILGEAAGLIERGHRVTLLCPPQAPIYAAARERGLPVVALPLARRSVSGWRAVRRWLAAAGSDVDLLCAHSSTDAWLTALAAATLRQAPPLLRMRHVSAPVGRGWPTRWLYQRAAAHVVTTGEAVRWQLACDNGFCLSHATSVPTGIDLHRFAPRPLALPVGAARAALGLVDRPTLLIVGTLRRWKGHAFLLDAFAGLHADFPDWQLVVVGDGPQRANLERQAAALGLAGDVVFAGNRDDVPRWLQAAEVFALPSTANEGVPQALMQAMACGLPVVGGRVGGIPEAVQDQRSGLLVPPADTPALQAVLRQLLSRPLWRRQLGLQARWQAERCFGLATMLDRMEAIYGRFARPPGAAEAPLPTGI